MKAVATFTDTYLPTVNGVTYTVETWRDRWRERGGRMPVVYPRSEHDPGEDEYPARSVPFPYYEGFRVALPRVPDAVTDTDIVHVHTPFALGLSGVRLASRENLPLVASYHTPTAEYADYLPALSGAARRVAARYERWFLDRADVVVAPSETTRDQIRETGVGAETVVVPNGIDTRRFSPTDPGPFRERHDLPEGPLVGYTGRHGYEKRLSDLVTAGEGLEATLVFGGDGPAREALEREAAERGVDARFLGVLDRDELPAFYSALDVFAFPSPVETQGLVALEANVCGTPVVGADSGALADTVDDGETGYHFETGDPRALRAAVRRALDSHNALRENCVATRETVSVERSLDRLESVYGRL
jgi:1,2-diacylglycerol 3-alpha-glucosyltransferase